MMQPLPTISIVMPVFEEGEAVRHVVSRIAESVTSEFELLAVYDRPSDSTVPVLEDLARSDSRVRPIHNRLGPGPAKALRTGIGQATGRVIVVTMADGSDDPRQIDDLARLVDRGVVVAAASRYMPGGQAVDAPLVKAALSSCAGRILGLIGRVGTRDATNSFKAYDRTFVDAVGIDSDGGFELGIELVAKARRLRLPVAEVPTIWIERQAGQSSFKLLGWLPRYFAWFRFAFGPRLDVDEVRRRSRQLVRRHHGQSTGDWRGGFHRRLRREGAARPRS